MNRRKRYGRLLCILKEPQFSVTYVLETTMGDFSPKMKLESMSLSMDSQPVKSLTRIILSKSAMSCDLTLIDWQWLDRNRITTLLPAMWPFCALLWLLSRSSRHAGRLINPFNDFCRICGSKEKRIWGSGLPNFLNPGSIFLKIFLLASIQQLLTCSLQVL